MNKFFENHKNLFENFYDENFFNLSTHIEEISKRSPLQFFSEKLGFNKIIFASLLPIIMLNNSSNINNEKYNTIVENYNSTYVSISFDKKRKLDIDDFIINNEDNFLIEKVLEEDFDLSKEFEEYEITLKGLKEPHPDNMIYFSKDFENKTPNINEIKEISSKYNVDENLLYAVMLKESHGRHDAVSQKGAVGQFQFLYKTAEEFNLVQNGIDYRSNGFAAADTAARYLLWLNRLINGKEADLKNKDNYKYVLAAYNAGLHNVFFRGKKKIPNYTETRNYVRDISLLYEKKGHYVERGQTIKQLSFIYEIPENAIKLNNLSKISRDGNLIAGTILDISKRKEIKYQVKKGDTLYGISKKTGIPVQEILEFNNQKTNNIRIGQIIYLPNEIQEQKEQKNNKRYI